MQEIGLVPYPLNLKFSRKKGGAAFMRIFLPEEIGFCFGVERALKLVRDELKKGNHIYTLGDLIHNPGVVESLRRKGVIPISSLSQISKGTLVIRSHGASPFLIKEERRKGLKILNATCPYVLRVQRIARYLSMKSYQVIIIGLATHPEVEGVMANVDKRRAYVVKTPEEATEIPFASKIGVVAQTTESIDNFENIVKNLVEKGREIRVFNTICKVIRQRQEITRRLAKKVEAMIVVGGHNSSNTHQLVKLCKSLKVKTYFVESRNGLETQDLKHFKKVGLVGGTSTPRSAVKEIKDFLLSIN